jgi:hypothetical protein
MSGATRIRCQGGRFLGVQRGGLVLHFSPKDLASQLCMYCCSTQYVSITTWAHRARLFFLPSAARIHRLVVVYCSLSDHACLGAQRTRCLHFPWFAYRSKPWERGQRHMRRSGGRACAPIMM